MKTIWYSHLPEDKQEDFKKYVSNSRSILKRIEDICIQKAEAESMERINKDEYELASWSYRQADSNGYLRALREIISLVEL